MKQDITKPRIIVNYDWKTDKFVKYQIDLKGALKKRARISKDRQLMWLGTSGGGIFSFELRTSEVIEYVPDRGPASHRELLSVLDFAGINDIKDMGPRLCSRKSCCSRSHHTDM